MLGKHSRACFGAEVKSTEASKPASIPTFGRIDRSRFGGVLGRDQPCDANSGRTALQLKNLHLSFPKGRGTGGLASLGLLRLGGDRFRGAPFLLNPFRVRRFGWGGYPGYLPRGTRGEPWATVCNRVAVFDALPPRPHSSPARRPSLLPSPNLSLRGKGTRRVALLGLL